MESLIEYLYTISSVFIFCMALSLLIIMNKNLNQLIFTAGESLKQVNTVYEQTYESIEDSNIITYSKLIGLLVDDLEYQIEINGCLINPEDYKYLTFYYPIIPQTNYRAFYYYNLSGNIIKAKFLSITKDINGR